MADLSKNEEKLLFKINHFWSDEKTIQYLNLQQKMQEKIISEEEYRTYMKLVEESEQRSLERVKNLVELAKIRKMSLPDLMERLNLYAHPLMENQKFGKG